MITNHRIAAAVLALGLGGAAVAMPAEAASRGSVSNVDGSGDVLEVTDIRPGRDRTAWVWPGGRSGRTFDVDKVRAVRPSGNLREAVWGRDKKFDRDAIITSGHHRVYVK